MKVLKTILTVIVVVALIIVVVSFFLPKKSTLSRSIIIGVPDSIAYTYVSDFSKFEEWSPFYEAEPTAKTQINGNVNEVGSSYSWNGKELGEGSLTIIKLEPYTAIRQKLDFKKPFESTAKNDFIFQPQRDSTKVSWDYEAENKGILHRWMGLMTTSMMGGEFEKGLQKMKRNLEK